MDRQEYSTIEKIEELWKKLYKENPSLSWFQSYLWNEALEKAFYNRRIRYHGCTLKYIVYDRRFIIPLVVNKREKDIELLGGKESSDYLSFIYDYSATDLELISWIKHFLNEFKGYSISLERINENNRLSSVLKEATKQLNVVCRIEERECVVVNTNTNTDTFVSSLSKSTRQNYRTAINRINKDGLKYKVINDYSMVSDSFQSELLNIYKERRADCDSADKVSDRTISLAKNCVKKMLGENDFDVLSEYSKKDKVFVSQIFIDDGLAAFCEGNFNNRLDCISIARVATNSQFYKYSPGMILLIDTIEQLKTNITFFDLTRGTEDYKFKLGGVIHRNVCFYFN